MVNNRNFFLVVFFSSLLFLPACASQATQATIQPSPVVSTTVVSATPFAPRVDWTATATYLPASTLTPTPEPSFTPEPTQTLTATPSEPAGCQKPPEDYTRIELADATLNMRTYAMLEYADTLYDGPIDLLAAITQGSYTDAVDASFGTHNGGGAVDLSVIDSATWTVLWDEIDPLLHALRTAGFAAWLRAPDELYPGSPIHIHAVAVGDIELSEAAHEQVYSPDYGYLAGMNGLPPGQGEGPAEDRFGGPVICNWMLE